MGCNIAHKIVRSRKPYALTCSHYMQHLLSRCDRIVKTANIFLTDNEMHRIKPKLSRRQYTLMKTTCFSVSGNSVWGASQNMGCNLRRCSFSSLLSLFICFGYTLYRVVLPPHQILQINVYMCTTFLPGWFV